MSATNKFEPKQFKRINVVGTSGCGKSTFSHNLAQILDLPHIELDAIFWEPNWTQPSDERLFARLNKALAPDGWILDGNYTRTIPIKWTRSEVVIWLDLPFSLIIPRAVNRAIQRSRSKQEIWPGTGNVETFRKSFFSRQSIILWTIKTFAKNRVKYERYMQDERFSHLVFIRLQSVHLVEQYLKEMQADQPSN